MTAILPPRYGDFECVSATSFPAISVPTGTAFMRLYPRKYFESWAKHLDRSARPYLSSLFDREVIPSLSEIEVGNIPEKQTVFVWKARTPIAWSNVYRNFPKCPVKPNDHQVVPFYRLQDLVLGWTGSTKSIIPKNDVGALLWLGNAGITQPSPAPGMASVVGQVKRLVQVSYYTPVSTPQWSLALPQKEFDSGHLCPEGMLFLTVW